MNKDYDIDDMVYIIPTPSKRPVKVVFERRSGLSDGVDALLSFMRRDVFSSFVYAIVDMSEDNEPQESQELDRFLDEFTILEQ